MAIMARDDLTLWLAGPQASASKPMPDGRAPEPGGWNRFVLQVTDLAANAAVRTATSRPFTAAGGITTKEEIADLEAIGVDAVVGMALYTGRLQLD